jgi:hypothetical protein
MKGCAAAAVHTTGHPADLSKAIAKGGAPARREIGRLLRRFARVTRTRRVRWRAQVCDNATVAHDIEA